MALTPRSLDEISQNVRDAFRQYLPGTDSALKNNFVTVTGKVLALVVYELELRIQSLLPQLFMATATGVFLERHCGDVGIQRRAASAATGPVAATGAASTVYPAGIRFRSGADIFVSTAAATSNASGDVNFTVKCIATGSSTNRVGGASIALADPVAQPSLSSSATIGADGLGGGADRETDTSLRSRGLQRKRNPPQSGALSDYERFVLAVPGVKRAWAFRIAGSPGAVVVHFLFDGRPNFIPQASDVAVVQAEIDAKRLIGSDYSAATAPNAHAVDIEIANLAGDNDEIRALIESGIATMLVERCSPGLDAAPFTLPVAWLSEVISSVSGEDRHTLIAPSTDITLTGGRFPVIGSVIYA